MATTPRASAQFSLILRVTSPAAPGPFAALVDALESAGGIVGDITLIPGDGPRTREVVVDAGHVLEDHPRLAADDALHLEAHRARGAGPHDAEPEVIIWGVGRSLFNGVFPPEQWRPRIVLDLNYAEDSPGREYALRLGIRRVRYVSGLGLFKAQAALQFT